MGNLRVMLPTPSRPHVVVPLQGGGSKGAYQVDLLDALTDAGLDPDWESETGVQGSIGHIHRFREGVHTDMSGPLVSQRIAAAPVPLENSPS